MSQLFDTKRFLQTLKHLMALRRAKIFSIAGMALGIVLVIIVINSLTIYSRYGFTTDPLWGLLDGCFWVGVSALACVGTGMMFEPLGKKTTAISVLMLPASQLEKYLSLIVISAILPVAIFVLGFELLDLMRCLSINLVYLDTAPAALIPPSYIFDGFSEDAVIGIIFLALIQSFFALGSCVWPRRGVAYTFIYLIITSLVFALWGGFLLKLMLSNLMDAHGTGSFSVDFDDTSHCTAEIFMIIAALTNYVIAYYRFKESEIINRF